MQIEPTKIPDVWILKPERHGDMRGYFMETFRASHFQAYGLEFAFLQDNQSRSTQGTLRGLHYQYEHPQGKLVRVIHGEV